MINKQIDIILLITKYDEKSKKSPKVIILNTSIEININTDNLHKNVIVFFILILF